MPEVFWPVWSRTRTRCIPQAHGAAGSRPNSGTPATEVPGRRSPRPSCCPLHVPLSLQHNAISCYECMPSSPAQPSPSDLNALYPC